MMTKLKTRIKLNGPKRKKKSLPFLNRIDEHLVARTGSNICYESVVADNSCPVCYSGFTCFSYAIPGQTDIDSLRMCIPDKADCDVHYRKCIPDRAD